MGSQVADDLPVSVADGEPDGRQDGGRAGVDVTDGDAHGLGNPVVQGSLLKRARNRFAVEHGLSHAARDGPQRYASGLDGPAPLPVGGIWNRWLCHVGFLHKRCVPDRP